LTMLPVLSRGLSSSKKFALGKVWLTFSGAAMGSFFRENSTRLSGFEERSGGILWLF
jgi:hypothetical protein